MIKFVCSDCAEERFIGQGRGMGLVKIQCAGCRRWHWVPFDTGEDLDELRKLIASGTLVTKR